ncbi:CD209 antigen-like protein D [Antedon mediterranea]|uniref:CD209 antigen-like protein D n=1 Tax=Antedon mediterranea TaxID=105859 RepID=UPI003AF6D02E
MSWSEARSNCLALGADLVVVRNQEENDFLYANIPVGGKLWLGISDVENFGFGEPNNAGYDEDCVELGFKGSSKWNDISCNRSVAYVCEIIQQQDPYLTFY